MKNIISLMIIFLVSVSLSNAQVPYPTQPKKGYYEQVKALAMSLVPTQEQLMNAKSSSIPAGFKDTLLKYDWYEIGNYYFLDKTYRSSFSADLPEREEKYGNNEFRFKRYIPEGVIYEMILDRHKDGSFKVVTTTFDEKNAVKLIGVKMQGTKTMMVTSIYSETEMQEILSYENGVLIVCVRQSPNSATHKFNIAYLAVSKAF